jgi:L-lactate dehydrogenase (cytochrome)
VIDTLRSVLRFRRLELDPVARRLARAASVADLRAIARRRLPRGVFDYIDGGAEDERTMVANAAAFAAVTFRPRVLRDVGHVDPSTTLLGRPLPLPLVLAPTGFTRIPTASSPWRARRRGRACPTRCRRSAPARSRRWPG